MASGKFCSLPITNNLLRLGSFQEICFHMQQNFKTKRKSFLESFCASDSKIFLITTTIYPWNFNGLYAGVDFCAFNLMWLINVQNFECNQKRHACFGTDFVSKISTVDGKVKTNILGMF